jgi:Family of unknown function (DUF6527)
MKLFNAILGLFKKLLSFFGIVLKSKNITVEEITLPSESARYRCQYTNEFPEVLDEGIVYLQGKVGHEWLAGFACPCGCGDVIELTMIKTFSPRWNISIEDNGVVTLTPSINRSVGCKSHFFITRGLVKWCK